MDMPVPQPQQIPQPQMQPPQPGPNMQATTGQQPPQQPMGQGPLGSGMANNAMMLTKFREPYMQMATQMAMDGQEPPPFEQWVQSQTQQPQEQAPQDRRGMLTRLISSLKGT